MVAIETTRRSFGEITDTKPVIRIFLIAVLMGVEPIHRQKAVPRSAERKFGASSSRHVN